MLKMTEWTEKEIKLWDENDFITQHQEDCETTDWTEETVWTSDTGVETYHQPEVIQRESLSISYETDGTTTHDETITRTSKLVSKEYLAVFEKPLHKLCVNLMV